MKERKLRRAAMLTDAALDEFKNERLLSLTLIEIKARLSLAGAYRLLMDELHVRAMKRSGSHITPRFPTEREFLR